MQLTNTHQHTPEDDETDDGCSGTGTNERLSKCGNDDEDQLKTVHLLATNDISESTEAYLANNGTGRSGKLDSGVLGSEEDTLVVVLVDDTQHDGQQRNTEDVITVGEETSSGDENSANVVPAKGCLIDLSKRQSSALVRIFDMSLVVVSCGFAFESEALRTKSLTVLWNALFPPAVLIAIVKERSFAEPVPRTSRN